MARIKEGSRGVELKELQEKATVGPLKIHGHYDAKKNVTRIKEKVKGSGDRDENDRKETLPGLVIISLSTDEGKIKVNY